MTDRTSNTTARAIQHDRQITADRPVLVDIKDTAAAALNRIDAICAHWLPDGKRQGHDWVARNPTRDDAHAGSFSVSLLTGGCIDHATGDQCHDIVSTIRYLDGLPTQGEAARRLANWMGTTPIIPIPPPTRATATRASLAMPDRPTRHPQLGAPSATWDYRDAAGNLIGCVWRFEMATGKAFRPLTRTPDGWIWKAPEEPRPLYGLDRLAARPDAKVLLCEGEKAADAAGRLLPEAVAIASMNGAMSPHKTDWSPLAGRTVRIWPDHDEPGHQYAKTAAALADRAGAVSVEILELLAASNLPDALTKGWDAADAEASGIRFDQIEVNARWVNIASPKSGDEGAVSPDDADDSSLAEAKALILAAIKRQPADPGAVFEQDIAAAWNRVYDACQADYQRLRKLAKEAGASVIEIDKACNIRNRRVAAKPKDKNYFTNNPSDPSDIRAKSFLKTSENLPKPEGWKPGYLIDWSDKNEPSRLIDSLAAEIVADVLSEKLAWDGEASTWHVWRENHWAALVVAFKAESLLAEAVHIGTDPIGYRLAYLNGITQIIQRRALLHPPQHPANVIPFRNGLLNLKTGTLTKATPKNAMDWALPHDYRPDADCPTIKAWLLRSVEDDQETVQLLRAWLAALIRGLPLQYFLLLLGRGGSGKGTFQRLAMALIGAHNAAISTLRDLEENRFETAKLYGKRLCMVNEAGRHGGALNMLKAITGGDHLPLERKHQQQSGSFLFSGLVLMATNEDLQSTDATSGLERRRITVRFPRSATAAEIADWDAQGGEQAVLHVEIPGLINWLLAMPEAEIKTRIGSPPLRVATDNMLGMAAGNSVADWMLSNTMPDPDAWTQIGVKKEGRERETGQTYFENADEWLYANYLAWCLESGRSRPVALRKFRDTVADMAETLGCPVHQGRHPQSRAYSIKGLRFVRKDDPSEAKDRWRAKGRMEPAFRKDRKDGR